KLGDFLFLIVCNHIIGFKPTIGIDREFAEGAFFHIRRQIGGSRQVTDVAYGGIDNPAIARSEEHTSELQSRFDLVCRLLLEKKKKNTKLTHCTHTGSIHSAW